MMTQEERKTLDDLINSSDYPELLRELIGKRIITIENNNAHT